MAEFRTDFDSDLNTPSSRFLSKAMQHALSEGWRKPEDFFRHFPPEAIMRALADAHELRAEILIKAANVHEKLARKKSIESASEDLRLAMEEGLTDPPSLLSLFPPDDCVRHLSAGLLWRFLFEGEFWTSSKGGADHERAVARMAFLLECGLEQKLITLTDFADGLSFEQIVSHLPPERLRKVLTHSLTIGRKGDPMTEQQLLSVVPLRQLLGDLPLTLVWDSVIASRVAAPAGFLDAAGAPPPPAPAASPSPPAAQAQPPAPAPSREPSSPAAAPPPAPPEQRSSPQTAGPSPAAGGTDSAATEARQQAIAKLTSIGRLPPSHEDLATPILLSIESMYEELGTLSSDEDREACIRDSFPNEAHLRTALLALIELLDPTIDVHKPPISDAEVDALVKVVLFEERQRQEQQGQGGSARRSSMRPPPLPTARGNTRAGPPNRR